MIICAYLWIKILNAPGAFASGAFLFAYGPELFDYFSGEEDFFDAEGTQVFVPVDCHAEACFAAAVGEFFLTVEGDYVEVAFIGNLAGDSFDEI